MLWITTQLTLNFYARWWYRAKAVWPMICVVKCGRNFWMSTCSTNLKRNEVMLYNCLESFEKTVFLAEFTLKCMNIFYKWMNCWVYEWILLGQMRDHLALDYCIISLGYSMYICSLPIYLYSSLISRKCAFQKSFLHFLLHETFSPIQYENPNNSQFINFFLKCENILQALSELAEIRWCTVHLNQLSEISPCCCT